MERTVYERYGNNEPYTEPDSEQMSYLNTKEPDTFFQLIVGPSTHFYVGPERIHYTIPKHLLYRFCDYAKTCLEGRFAEAETNAVSLPDISPDVFQWMWKWLYQGQLQIERYFYSSNYEEEDHCRLYDPFSQRQACQLLCRVHMLGERFLFDMRFLVRGVHAELQALVERAKEHDDVFPFTPEIMQEVLSESEPVHRFYGWPTPLRRFVLAQLCNYEFCATMDFREYGMCSQLDGLFAAELMMYMAGELEWARELWGAQTESDVDVVEKKLHFAKEEGNFHALVKMPKMTKSCRDLWWALRYLCTFQACTNTDFRMFSACFELDGLITAEILAFMAEELWWIREKWGVERGPKVNVQQEKDDEEWNEQNEADLTRMYNRVF